MGGARRTVFRRAAGPIGRRAVSMFPAIADYAFLSDCQNSCLIAPDGAVEWLCLPRPDSPSVFGSILDRSAGFFRLGPLNTAVPHQRRYLPGTMVLETTWHAPTGWLVVEDLLVLRPVAEGPRRTDYLRAPADVAATGTLLRRARCIDGSVDVVASCQPLFDYGLLPGTWAYDGESYHQMSITCDGAPPLHLSSNLRLATVGASGYGRTTLGEGETAFVALTWGESWPETCDDVAADIDTTVRYWRGWLSGGTFPDHRWRAYLERSALTLKGLSYAPTGAIMAASTTSLPETPGGARNWDYRFTWIRDTGFMLRSLYRLGFAWEAFEFFAFVVGAVTGEGGLDPELQIMYGIGGERDLTEHTVDHLSGWRDSRPVRVGNGAWDQQQNDVWGMLLDAIDTHLRQDDAARLAPRTWAGAASFVEAAIARSGEPDQGIWEIRGDPEHFTASQVMCWVAAERGAKLGRQRGDPRAEQWQKAADAMKADVLERAVDERGRFRQHYDNDELDASLLLIPLMGFLPPEDPRVRATVLAIADELTRDGLVLRYRVDATDTGFEGDEGTFTICSFWLVTALAMIGETVRAKDLCSKLLALAGPLKLYAEEIDATSGEHLGNFPQAFTHLALIEAVSTLIAAGVD